VPVVVDLVVERGRLPASPAVLRGLLGQLITDPPGCHGSGFKPYRTGQLVTVQGRAQSWRLAWLREAGGAGAGGQWPAEPPWPVLADGVRFSVNDGSTVLVRERARSEISYGQLWRLPGRSEIVMEFRSPVYFRRSARKPVDGGVGSRGVVAPRRMWPLPDPVLVFDSLRESWKQCAPAELAIGPELLHDLLDHVQVRDFTGGTRPLYPGARQRAGASASEWENAVGFVGRAMFGLARTASPEVVRCFTSLAHFAGYAGVGAQRTYGFGDVMVHHG
jgi:CRISPR-associated endoribonuclease Cas6